MTQGTVTVAHGTAIGKMVPGVAGFSFEKTHITDGFFTANNAPLIALFRTLGTGGYMRIGANDVNKTHWVASATPMPGGQTSDSVGTADVDGLAAFLKAADWNVMYGLDLTGETSSTADVAEAKYAAQAIGRNLYTFEMGNEPVDYTTFRSQWESFQTAIKAVVPNALFNGPESNQLSTVTQFAVDDASRIVLLTHHHYIAGAGTMDANVTYMLSAAAEATAISQEKTLVAAAAHKIRDGFRWGEDNSYYNHGEAGVSDAYASALWGIQHMFDAAENGAVGVNFHDGGQNMDGNTCSNGVSSCSKPFRYSPIDEVNSQVTAAAPLYYGMLFVSRSGTGNLYATSVSSGGLNVYAHSLGLADGSTNVIIINNDANTGFNAKVSVGTTVTSASAAYLRGTSLSATSGATFAGAGVTASGSWTPTIVYTAQASGQTVTVVVPPASAVLVHAQ